jgi:hypothetical protein
MTGPVEHTRLYFRKVGYTRYGKSHSTTVRISREIPCVCGGGGLRLWCGSGGKFTGGWTKGLLLVKNSMTHQGDTLLHTD